MASYSPKLSDKKYNNWVKAQLAVLFTKDGLEPFVCHEVREFRLKCLDGICYNNGLISGTFCSNCCTENVIKCPTDKICNVGRGKCSYHRNAATRYNPAGCPNKICHNFTTEIQNAHRYNGPTYKNTDATQWCSNSWEIAKCFMPPDGYKDKAYATETDFNGIISVILNYKDFQMKIHENLNNKTNMFEEAREIGRKVRHSSTLEVEDSDLQKYFKLLQKLLSDQVYLATDTHAQKAKRKLTELENDTLVIGKDDIRKVLDDVAKAIQDKMKAGLDEQYGRIKLNMIKRKQEDLQSFQSQIAEGVTQLKDEADAAVKRLNEERDKEVQKIHEQGDKERADLAGLGETLHKRLKTASKDEKEKQYIEFKQRFDAINPLCFNSGAVRETSEIRRRTEVYKFGMSSEITRGSFALQGAVVRKSQMQGQCHGFGFKLMNQMVVLKIGDNPFAEPGDSGALALIEGGQDSIAIGIVEGGMNGRVFVTPICDILRAVGCTELKMHRFTRKCTQLSPDSAEEMEI